MTKLEQKLIQLGYQHRSRWFHGIKKIFFDTYDKFFEVDEDIFFNLTIDIGDNEEINGFIYEEEIYFRNKQDIDNLQQAFNQLQSDLEVLKEDE